MSEKKIRVAYILAASHSGSTLLAMMLNAHPDVCSVGELKVGALGDVERYLCSCKSRLVECSFWQRVRQGMEKRGYPFDFENPGTDIRRTDSRIRARLLKPMVRGPAGEFMRDLVLGMLPGWRKHKRLVQEKNIAFLEVLSDVAEAKVVGDSSKVGVRLKYLLEDPRLDVRVIRLIRDGRGVALTYVDPSRFADSRDERNRGGGMGELDVHPRLTMTQAAEEWRRANVEAEHLLRRAAPGCVHEVRYEELCTNPVSVMDGIFDFLGIPEQSQHSILSVDDREHHIVGNGMRLDESHEIVLDERWRHALSEIELQEFSKIAGEANARYGYS